MEIRIEGSDAVNDWDFWVYPAQVELTQGDVYTTDTLDAKAISILQEGGNVLITAAGKIQYGKEVKQYFTPVFWNTSWFKMRPPHTTGIFLNEYHPQQPAMVGTAEQSTGHAVYRIPDRIPTDHPEHRHLVYQPENRNVIRSQRTERQIDNDQHGHHFETGKTGSCPADA